MSRRRTKPLIVTALALATFLATSALGDAKQSSDAWEGEPKELEQPRQQVPEDRYAMAGGCYVVRTPDGSYIAKGDSGYTTKDASDDAEPFHFQATDLGRYLLFDTGGNHVAASEGALAEAAYTATRSQPGNMAGGLAHEQTDRVADELARSDANRASGRGASVVAEKIASTLADWKIAEAPGGFEITLPATDQALVVEDATLALADDSPTTFSFELSQGCAEFPEIEVNVDGPVIGGQSPFQEVRGFMDLHLHMMAFEFLGGRARCGRPWHPYGVTQALVDCEDHKPGGYGAILEQVVTKQNPGTPHNTDGWPTFEGWPKYNSLTHEQVYYRWLERAWRSGLRMFTNLLVDNNQLCKIYPYKKNSCNEMDGVRLQAKRINQLQDYVDAQSGGPGEGWLRIVKSPFEAREVINAGKLAVVLGIEVSVPLDCGETLEQPRCDFGGRRTVNGYVGAIEKGLDEVYDLGVRQMELVNKFDNAFSGVAGDAGTTGVVVNQGNLLETGHYWKMETCDEQGDAHEHAHDNTQMNFHDESGAPEEFSGRDSLAGAILAQAGVTGATPVYPEGPHCNTMGLTDLGERMIRAMAKRGIIFDPDHMSAAAQAEALSLVEELGYSGIVSSHGWSNDTIYPRIYRAGGVITPYAGGSQSFVDRWRDHKEWADPRYIFGFGYGADTNGFGSQGGPRGKNAPDPVTYPFTGFGGVTVNQQESGTRTYDVNSDGVSHYGLYPDWIEELRRQAGDEIIEDMTLGPEAYLQMWERAIGIAPDACRADVADLTDARFKQLQKDMSFEDVLRTLGQPSSRTGQAFTYCISGGRTATLEFDDSGNLAKWSPRSVGAG